MPNADLSNLSSPVDETEKPKESEKTDSKLEKDSLPDTPSRNIKEFMPIKELKVLIGIIIVVVISIIGVMIFQPQIRGWFWESILNQESSDDDGINNSNEVGITTVQYTRFQGTNYIFYFPQEYGYLDRMGPASEPPLEVYFNDIDGNLKFWLKEYIWRGPLDLSIGEAMNLVYGNREHRAGRNQEFFVGDKLLLKREYSELVCDETGICDFKVKATGYGAEAQGIYVFIFNESVEQEEFERNIMLTLNTQTIESETLTMGIIKEHLSAEMMVHEALRFYGIPEFGYVGNQTLLRYTLADESRLVLTFEGDEIISANNFIPDAKLDVLGDVGSTTTSMQALNLVKGFQEIRTYSLESGTSLYYEIMTDDFNPEVWNVEVVRIQDETGTRGNVFNFKIDKQTGQQITPVLDPS